LAIIVAKLPSRAYLPGISCLNHSVLSFCSFSYKLQVEMEKENSYLPLAVAVNVFSGIFSSPWWHIQSGASAGG